MTEQILDLAQITTGCQQMGRKGVSQGVGRGRVGQTEAHAQTFHDIADQTAIQRSALRPTKHGCVAIQGIGAEREVACDGVLRDR